MGFLAGYDLTPTMRDINKKFSVRYYLNLVLVDEEDRRYFKQQEITLWRKGDPRTRKGQQMPPSGLPVPAYQVPHAMARHNPGEFPSANVRTAPTPSEPNTPIAEPGFTVSNTFPQQQPHQHPSPLPEEEGEEPPMPEAEVTQPPKVREVLKEQLPEEVPSEVVVAETDKIETAASIQSAASIPVAEPEVVTIKPAPTPPVVEESNQPTAVLTQSPPQISRQIEESNHKIEPAASIQAETTTAAPPPLEAAPPTENSIEENQKTKTTTKTETISNENNTAETEIVTEVVAVSAVVDTTKIEEKMSNLNTNSEAHSTPEIIEDRHQPPEDDTVPDIDDLSEDHEDATAIVDNDFDEDDDENNDL